jgi:hypothetical protein
VWKFPADQPAESDRVTPIEGGKHICGDCGEQVLHEASYNLCTDMLYCVMFHHYWRISNEVYSLTLLDSFSSSTFDVHALRLALRLCFVTLNFLFAGCADAVYALPSVLLLRPTLPGACPYLSPMLSLSSPSPSLRPPRPPVPCPCQLPALSISTLADVRRTNLVVVYTTCTPSHLLGSSSSFLSALPCIAVSQT